MKITQISSKNYRKSDERNKYHGDNTKKPKTNKSGEMPHHTLDDGAKSDVRENEE